MTARGYHTKHGKGNSLLRGHEHDPVVAAAAAASTAAVAAHATPAAAAAGHAAEVADVIAWCGRRRVLGRYSNDANKTL